VPVSQINICPSNHVTLNEIETQFTELTTSDQFHRFEVVIESHQRAHCEVYSRYGRKYLPIAAFKHADVTTFPISEAEDIFMSSSTGGNERSRHFIRKMSIYQDAVCAGFESVFGPGPFTIWAFLPGYIPNSSLVRMLKILIERYGHDNSQFFLSDHLPQIESHDPPLIFFGAAFGLLDLVESNIYRLPGDARIVETGGMKTHRREMTRAELHAQLARGFGLQENRIWSEYGMCELLSQAYAKGGGVYYPPPWMRVIIVDPLNPEQILPEGEAGLLAITDLANIHTVSSILTEDLGVKRGHGFEVLGRFPGSALRGCNFLLDSG